MLCSMIIFLDSRLCWHVEAWRTWSRKNPPASSSRKNAENVAFFSLINLPHIPRGIVKRYQSRKWFTCKSPVSTNQALKALTVTVQFSWSSATFSPANHDTPASVTVSQSMEYLSISFSTLNPCRPDHHAIPRETLQRPDESQQTQPDKQGQTCRWDSPIKHRATWWKCRFYWERFARRVLVNGWFMETVGGERPCHLMGLE